MTDEALRELLHDLGEDQPPVVIPADTYRRGRRAHRRRVAAATAACLAVAGAASAVPFLDLNGPDRVPPAGSAPAPAMPDRLYAVPERLTSFTAGPSGWRWHEDVAAPDLAIGTTAAVFPVDGGAVVAVSARDGSYAGLDLPGFDEHAYFRFEDTAVALSPDGERLAWTWNRDVIGGAARRDAPSGVRLADLRTGEVTHVRIRGGYGVYAHGFSWSPDGRYLAYNLDVTTSPGGGVRGTRNFRMQRLDTRTGEVLDVAGLARADHGPAVSDRGEVATVGNGRPASWHPDRSPRVRAFEGGIGEWTAAWGPDGRLATGSFDRGWFGVGTTGSRGLISRTAADAPSGSRVRALGWAGGKALVAYAAEDGLRVAAVPTRGAGAGKVVVDVEPGDVLTTLSVATDLLTRPARELPEPDWPTDWARVATWAGVGAAVLLALLVRWRRRGPATGP